MATTISRSAPTDSGILLEAGTNELEVLVLELGGERYGVNVAKVREVLPAAAVTALPDAHAAVEGVVRIRHDVVEVVNLARYLNGPESEAATQPGDLFLVLEFNAERLAFRVGGVERIYRISWGQIQPMPKLRDVSVPATGVVRLEEKLVLMLDFETIGADIGMGRAVCDAQRQQIAARPATPVTDALILVAEDSQMITTMALDALTAAGYQRVRAFADGQEAWEFLQQAAAEARRTETPIDVGALISDIEMPRMDGLTLTRRLRCEPLLGQVPVILFSSIVSRDNEKKGEQVGADAQVTKPRYGDLVATLGRLLAQRPA